MKLLFFRLSCLLGLFCLAPASTPVLAAESASQQEIEAKLKELEAEISRFKEMLDSTTGEKSEIEENLKRNEKGISELIKKIEDIETNLKDGEDRVSKLTSEQKELLQAKSEQQYYIEQQIRAAYETGNQEYLKVLLNQEDPDEIARMLAYYDYFNRARAEQIVTYNNTIEELDRVTRALTEENERLMANRKFLNAERAALNVTRRQKKIALEALIEQIASTGTEITRLQKNRERLEQLLDKINSSLAAIPTPSNAQPFSGMLGKLLLPVTGKISHKFGHQRNEGKLRWRGVHIDAPEGTPVYRPSRWRSLIVPIQFEWVAVA